MRGGYTTGEQTPWYVLGRWASGDGDIARATLDGQGDPWSTIFTDTFSIDDAAAGRLLRSYRLRLTLYREPGRWRSPRVWMLGTAGHLFVVVGFTATGDVIVNDPASSSDDAVRNVYRRDQFERSWLRTKRVNAGGGVSGGSGGVAYLIKPWWKPWPSVAGSTNW